jgi:hypothetical protein
MVYEISKEKQQQDVTKCHYLLPVLNRWYNSTSCSLNISNGLLPLLNRWCNSTTGNHLRWQQGGNKVPLFQEQLGIQLYIIQEERNCPDMFTFEWNEA